MRRRLVIPGVDLNRDEIKLPQPAVRHVALVLRLGRDDELLLLDGHGTEAEATIDTVSPGQVTVRITSRSTVTQEHSPDLHLIQSLPKKGKLDEIIRCSTELGATTITPVISERSVSRPSTEQLTKRVERWRRIGVEASRQCRRSVVPHIDDVCSLEVGLTQASSSAVRIMLWEGESSTGLEEVLASSNLEHGATLVVGPEGGFSALEARAATDHGFELASLGPRVLRVDTAALAACSVVQLYLGGFAVERRKR